MASVSEDGVEVTDWATLAFRILWLAVHTLNSTYLEPGAKDPAGTEVDRDRVNGYMSKNVLNFKKCSENREADEKVAGQGAASEEEAWVGVLQ